MTLRTLMSVLGELMAVLRTEGHVPEDALVCRIVLRSTFQTLAARAVT